MTCARCGSDGFGCYECTPDPFAIIARLTAERDAALAQVAGAYEAAAQTVDTAGDSAVTEALGQRLCCSGQLCGCQGADVGAFLVLLIRALTPADATTALDSIKRQARAEGLQQAYDLSGGYHQVTHIRAAILAAIKGEELL